MSSSTTEPDPVTVVRLLINDPVTAEGDGALFGTNEIELFLTLEDGHVKLAAAQAIDTIADNEALVAKVIRTQQLSTDGTKVADSLRKRATELRRQADKADDDADEGFFDLIPATGQQWRPELTEGVVSGIDHHGWFLT